MLEGVPSRRILRRWIGDGDDPMAGWLECMVSVLMRCAQELRVSVKKIIKCWDLGSNPGPPTQYHARLAIWATVFNC